MSTYIDPSGDPDVILTDIQSSELILGEAMHACIVADSLRVPWVAVRLLDHLLPFKWSDWRRSLELEYEPLVYSRDRDGDLRTFLSRLRSSAWPSLSDTSVFTSKLNRLHDLLGELRKAHGARICVPQATAVTTDPPLRDSSAWLRADYSGVRELAGAVPQTVQ